MQHAWILVLISVNSLRSDGIKHFAFYRNNTNVSYCGVLHTDAIFLVSCLQQFGEYSAFALKKTNKQTNSVALSPRANYTY
jgi:hypothetical protein